MKIEKSILVDYLQINNTMEVKSKESILRYVNERVDVTDRANLIEVLENLPTNKSLYRVTFLGHGAIDKRGNTPGMTNGLGQEQLLEWEAIADIFRRKNQNEFLILNFMAVCFSNGLRIPYLNSPFCKELYGSNCPIPDVRKAFIVFEEPTFDEYHFKLFDYEKPNYFGLDLDYQIEYSRR